jgi:septal ring-binding cell division protein DamX
MDRFGVSFSRQGTESISPSAPARTEAPQADTAKAVAAEPKAGAPGMLALETAAATAPAAAPVTSVPPATAPAPASESLGSTSNTGNAAALATAPPSAPSSVAPPSASLAAASVAAPPSSGTSSPGRSPAAVPAVPIAPPSGKLTQERFAATQQWLRTAPARHYTIQLLTVSAADIQVMERFLRQAEDLVDVSEMRVYSVKLNGQQHYSATYGLYPSLEETITAMGDLPSSFKSRGPYHRSVTLMRRQNQE